MLVNVFEDMLSGDALNLWWLATLAFYAVAHGWSVSHADLQVITESQFARWPESSRSGGWRSS
jgi:hypothetical protein